MNLREIKETIADEINELEKGMYHYESIVKPRMEKDKQILERLRDQHIKIDSLIRKEDRGDEITEREIKDIVPKQFFHESEEEPSEKAKKMP